MLSVRVERKRRILFVVKESGSDSRKEVLASPPLIPPHALSLEKNQWGSPVPVVKGLGSGRRSKVFEAHSSGGAKKEG